MSPIPHNFIFVPHYGDIVRVIGASCQPNMLNKIAVVVSVNTNDNDITLFFVQNGQQRIMSSELGELEFITSRQYYVDKTGQYVSELDWYEAVKQLLLKIYG